MRTSHGISLINNTGIQAVGQKLFFSFVMALIITCITLVSFEEIFAADIEPEAISATKPIKWNPGHYYKILPTGKYSNYYMNAVYRDLEQTPALRGLQISYTWQELESDKGVYDFSLIDQQLAELSAQGKRLIIMIQTRLTTTNKPDTKIVPDYLMTDLFEGGEFSIGSSSDPKTPIGKNIKLWNDNVLGRLIELFKALGNRYNTHTYFEGIGMTETAMGQPIGFTLTSEQQAKFYSNLGIVQTNMRQFFPNTMTYQYANYPRPILGSLVNTLVNVGGTLSCPDVFLDESDLTIDKPGRPKGVYNYYSDVFGIIPRAVQVEDVNYENTRSDGTGYQPTVHELLRYARDTLKVNYIFWQRDPTYYPKVLEVLSWKAQNVDVAGGLDTTCPSAYAFCISK